MSIGNSTTTLLRDDLLLRNQLELVAPTTVAGTLYGIAFTLFCLYVHALAPRLQNGDRKTQAKLMIVYSTVIILCGLYILVFNAWIDQDAYVKHSNYPGSPYSYILSINRTSHVVYVGFTCQVVIDVLTSAIQIWRVWVIWSATQYATPVAVLPVLCFLTFTGLRLRTLILEFTLPYAEYRGLDRKTNQADVAIQGATTILCTLLISSILVFKQWQQRQFIGESQGFTGYVNLVAMIIESYALESVWLLALLALWNRPTVLFFTESRTYIEMIAYLLVQYRVARGQSYESQKERKTRNISSLCWNRSNHARTQFEEAVEIHATIPAVSEVAGGSSMA